VQRATLAATLDEQPGFRRRFRFTPGAGWVRAEVEDDFHCMSLTVQHRDGIATSLEPAIVRAPWTTCPGAIEQLKQTFTGVALEAFAERGEKRSNCTHLHDLATLGAAHAFDDGPVVYDVLVSDPVDDGRRQSELRRNGVVQLRLAHVDGRLVDPPELTGITLDKLGPWIASLAPELQEAARVLRWGTMIANGRTIPMERQSNASNFPVGNCFTFQPQMRLMAKRIGEIRDFSAGAGQSLAHPLDGREPVAPLH
jgi:fermentation-respiration switch protein FrsA (DUF1100 family)